MAARCARPAAGVTLIELVVVLAIVAILASIALPSYQSHVVRTQRAMAAVCLADAAQYMERVYATNLRYDLNNGAATALPAAQCRSDLAARYTIALDPAALQQRAYSVSAAPLGAQAAADTACATLAIDQTGTKSISGSGSVAACWR